MQGLKFSPSTNHGGPCPFPPPPLHFSVATALGSEFTWPSHMFDRLLKMPRVLNKPGFWIWHGFICKGYSEFRICLIMAQYVSIMPEYASVYLNVLQYTWTWLNIAECPWICLKKLFFLCQSSQYAVIIIIINNIIIVTNVIVLL